MQKRRLGRTNLQVSIVGFGGIPIQRISKEEAKKVIDKCLEVGINFIDTARAYTVSEEFIGYAIKGNRDKWILATKSPAKTYADMKRDIETSLRNLQTDYIDLYQLHNPKGEGVMDQILAEDGAYKALLDAKKEGKIGHIGITNHSADFSLEAIKDNLFETIQFPYNPIENLGEEKLFKKAAELDMGIIAMKPIAGGAFNADLSLKYILNNPLVTTAIPGMDSIEQVIKNSSIGINLQPLTEEEKAEIEKIVKEIGTEFCRRCGYCAPCPQGIDIPFQFILEGYYTRYDLKDWAIDRYNGQKVKADACVKCGACEPRCPYDLPIRKMLERVDKYLSK